MTTESTTIDNDFLSDMGTSLANMPTDELPDGRNYVGVINSVSMFGPEAQEPQADGNPRRRAVISIGVSPGEGYPTIFSRYYLTSKLEGGKWNPTNPKALAMTKKVFTRMGIPAVYILNVDYLRDKLVKKSITFDKKTTKGKKAGREFVNIDIRKVRGEIVEAPGPEIPSDDTPF